MEAHNKIFLGTVLVLVLLVALLFVQPAIQKQLAPELVSAWVAFETADSSLAEVGPLELPAGTPFKLHAVLEARDRSGQTIYYTEAQQLRLGGEEIPRERLSAWDRPREVRVRWLTLEGTLPYFELDADKGLSHFEIKPFFRSDWPMGWVIPGEIDSAHDSHLVAAAEPALAFGTQRYQVRVELYDSSESVVPQRTFTSWGVAELRARPLEFPTVRMAVASGAGPASKVFGLTQLEVAEPAEPALLTKIDELADLGFAFRRLTVLRDQIRGSGKTLGELIWRTVDLLGTARWDEGIAAGDLLRVGERMVVLYEDQGLPQLLDGEDLCFDFVDGAAVRRLDDVFSGNGDVELAALSGASSYQEAGAQP